MMRDKLKSILLEIKEKISNISDLIKVNRYFPYIVCLFLGVIFYITARFMSNETTKGLILNISSAFISIPILHFFYEEVKNVNERERYKKNYEKLTLELQKETEYILKRIRLFVFPYPQRINEEEDIQLLKKSDSVTIKNYLDNFYYLGFKIHQGLGINLNRLNQIARHRIFQRIFPIEAIDQLNILCNDLEILLERCSPNRFTQIDNSGSAENFKINMNNYKAEYTQHYAYKKIIDFVFKEKGNQNRDLKKYIDRTKKLKKVTVSVNLLAKSKSLWNELPRKLHETMILTDFRPFFSDGIYSSSEYGFSDSNMKVENGCIVHTLKINYEEEGKIKQFHVSLDKKSYGRFKVK